MSTVVHQNDLNAVTTPSVAPETLSTEPRWKPWFCFIVMLAGLQAGFGHIMRLSQWGVNAGINCAVAEGDAWLHGRLDLAHEPGTDLVHNRRCDSGYVNGRVFNLLGPILSILTVVLAPINHALTGRTDFWLPWLYSLLVFWPLPIVGYVLFRRQAADSAWGAVLTASWLAGTAVLPNLFFASRGELGQIHHLMSQTGLLLLAADLLGRQRIWPALIGLAIATWSRQMTFLYALPLLFFAWRRARLAPALIGIAMIAAPLLTLNTLKFGNPLDFGYRYMYVGREDADVAKNCLDHGMFSIGFFPRNFKHMHLKLPEFDAGLMGLTPHVDWYGVSIWSTTPLLLMVLFAARQWWSDVRRRVLMLATLPVMTGILFYHDPGFIQFGYMRYALDFIPIWLVVIAPWTRGGWRTYFTIACTAWSMLYFSLLQFD